MASKSSLAFRSFEARERLETVLARLSEEYGVEREAVGKIKDADLKAVMELETFASFLESLSGKLGIVPAAEPIEEEVPAPVEEAAPAEVEEKEAKPSKKRTR